MKIYFGFTVAGDRSAVEVARRIVDILVEMRHEVLTRHLVEDNAWEADRRITPKEVYLRDMKWLEQCDFFMAEVSGSSFGLGFETRGRKLDQKQRVAIRVLVNHRPIKSLLFVRSCLLLSSSFEKSRAD